MQEQQRRPVTAIPEPDVATVDVDVVEGEVFEEGHRRFPLFPRHPVPISPPGRASWNFCFRPSFVRLTDGPILTWAYWLGLHSIETNDFRYIPAEPLNPTNVRFWSKEDINASAEKGPLSGVKRT